MLCNYRDYLNEQKAISFEECLELHREILSEIGSNPDAVGLYDELVEKAIEYAEMRANWTVKSREWKIKQDVLRTSKHDSLIIKCNMLSRYLRKEGKKAASRDRLGYQEDGRIYRKRIGDFGCFLSYIHGINGR